MATVSFSREAIGIIARVALAGSTDVTRQHLNGVFIGQDGRVCATNGKILATALLPDEDRAACVAINGPSADPLGAIIGGAVYAELRKRAKNERKLRLVTGLELIGRVVQGLSEGGSARLFAEGSIIEAKLIDGQYPNVRNVFPTTRRFKRTKQLFNPEWTALALSIFGVDSFDISGLVPLDTKPDHPAWIATSRSPIAVAIMPVVNTGDGDYAPPPSLEALLPAIKDESEAA